MYARYAIFYTPPPGPLWDFGASWLGWDSACGKSVAHPRLDGIDVAEVTARPRKYGLHGTLKAPFRLTAGSDPEDLQAAVAAFAAETPAVVIERLELRHDHGYVALRPVYASDPVRALASRVVRALDRFRAPHTEADLLRRRQAGLSPRQDRQMLDWGYPYVFEDFHFHLTLSGALAPHAGAAVIDALRPLILPLVPAPLVLDRITLMGQDGAGLFHQIREYGLTG